MGDTESNPTAGDKQKHEAEEDTPESGVKTVHDSRTDTMHDSGVDTTHDSGVDSQECEGHGAESVAQTPDSGVDTRDFAKDIADSVEINSGDAGTETNDTKSGEDMADTDGDKADAEGVDMAKKCTADSTSAHDGKSAGDGAEAASTVPTNSGKKDELQSSSPVVKMEEELAFLSEEVRTKAATVRRLQTSLFEQQVRSNVAMVSLRTQLRKKDMEAKKVRAQHEQQMSTLLSHLLYLEGQMKQEQREVVAALQEKDDVIRRQRAAIEDLASKNTKLLAALKEAHGYSGNNGISPFPSPIVGGEKGGNGMVTVAGQQVVLRNKDKDKDKDKNGSYKIRFSSVKDKLRRHKSSLELYRPEVLGTLVESTLRYGSQENVSDDGVVGAGGGHMSGMSSDELKRSRLQERREKCRSMVDYPFRLNDLPEVSADLERGKLTPEPQIPPRQQPLSASPNHLLSSPGARDLNPQSDEEEVFSNGRAYGELAKSTSMPQSLSGSSEHEGHVTSRARPHSLHGVDLMDLNSESVSSTNKVSMAPSPTSSLPPGGSESNPFKSFKNVFKRRNSKQRSKKRPVSLGQDTNQEYHEVVNAHFKKYDLS